MQCGIHDVFSAFARADQNGLVIVQCVVATGVSAVSGGGDSTFRCLAWYPLGAQLLLTGPKGFERPAPIVMPRNSMQGDPGRKCCT